MRDDPILSCKGLSKSYGSVKAVRDFSLTMHAGELWGLIGPNGSGKTTSIESAIGLRPRDSGEVECLGIDPARHPRRLVGKIAVQLQGAAIHPSIKVREHLQYVAASFGQGDRLAGAVKVFRLDDNLNVQFGRLSGGTQRRVMVAAAYLTRPQLLILDEPTTGVDPEARIALWTSLIQAARVDSLSVLVTTHDLADAERYISLYAVMRDGVVLATGTLEQLRSQLGTGVVAILRHDLDGPSANVGQPDVGVTRSLDDRVIVGATDESTLPKSLSDHGDVEIRAANLEDLYLLHTGGRANAAYG